MNIGNNKKVAGQNWIRIWQLLVYCWGNPILLYTEPMVYGSIIVLISSIGVSYAIIAGGENEERIRQMEERIRKLEAEKEKEE